MTPVRRRVHVPLYWLIVGFATSLLSPVLAVVVSVHVNNNTIQQQEKARDEAKREALVRYCLLLGSQVDVYAESTSDVGRNARAVWLREYNRNGCQPPRR